jgi:preprotein translocase subunit SecD/SecD/SecF fusion protein
VLYFSKFKIITVFLISVFFIIFASSNFLNTDNSLLSKKINLGLDLQGGSYLLLEIDNEPVEIKKLQNSTTSIRNFLKDKNINFTDLKLVEKSILFNVESKDAKNVEEFFLDKESEINPYFNQYKSHKFDLTVDGNNFLLKFSKYGLIEIKNSSQDQAIEIVRRRVDEVGTNEPNILKRGSDRILVELPGLDDPMRIKSLLGKTANLSFRLVTENANDNFGVEKLFFENDDGEALVTTI